MQHRRDTTGGDPMSPDDVSWRSVSPRLALARRIVAGIVYGVVATGLITLGVLTQSRSVSLSAVVPLLLFGGSWWVIGRQVRALGYAERDDDLLIRRGVMFRSLVVVPYGRMQFVDVGAGPLDRALGIARVQLHTASPASDASIPGLPPERAAELRDQLARRGEARLAGL